MITIVSVITVVAVTSKEQPREYSFAAVEQLQQLLKHRSICAQSSGSRSRSQELLLGLLYNCMNNLLMNMANFMIKVEIKYVKIVFYLV